MVGPTVFVSSPLRKPRKGGVKSVVGEFVTTDRLGAAEVLEWVADNCEFPKAAPGLCYTPVPVTGNKTYVGVAQGTGPIFGLYTGVKCYLGPWADYDQRARDLLVQGEGRGVEEMLVGWAAGKAAGGASFTTLVRAIAELEEVADTGYLGLPVLIMSRSVAVRARAEGALQGDEETGRLWSANGTPVIATGAAGDLAIYIIGWPTIYASEITVVGVMDTAVNTEMALAERVYGIAVDCEVAHKVAIPAATATTTGNNPPKEK